MVKGISKQVIVVKSPDPRFFEQAIFIVREDALGRIPLVAYTAFGALAVGVLWIVSSLI